MRHLRVKRSSPVSKLSKTWSAPARRFPFSAMPCVQAADGKLIISTTDLDTGIRASVDAEVIKGGATTLPARRLFSIIRELPAAELTLEVDSKQVATITSGASFFRIMGLPEEDFPPFPKGDGAKTFKISQGVFRDMLKRTAYAISTDESRYVLNGVLLSFKENKLSLVATDGRRLALVEQDLEFPKGSEVEAILPTKAVQELQRILRDEEPLTISFAENQVSFDLGNTFLYSKLIEGNYPNYKQVVPGRGQGTDHPRARNFPQRRAPRRAALERKIEFGEAHLHQEQPRHHRQHARSRRSQGIASPSTTRARNSTSPSIPNSSWTR